MSKIATLTSLTLVLIAMPTDFARAAKLADCESSFESIAYDQHNQGLHYRYKQIESEQDPYLDSSFSRHIDEYVAAMKKRQNWSWGARQFNQDGISARVTERMYLLWNREPSPEAKKEIGLRLAEVDGIQERLVIDRSAITQSNGNPQVDRPIDRLFAEVAPKIDGENVKKNKDLVNWNHAMEAARKLASRNSDLTKNDLDFLAAVLQGHEKGPSATATKSYTQSAEYLVYDDVNFYFTKTPGGRNKLDPRNSFIPGSAKHDALMHFIKWLKQSRTTMHPVIAAARARQFIVSVHPLWDSNGRLARIVANYVLMRAGYPPAHIPRGTESENVSVALFPLKDFNDQISPEESIHIMIDGVLRSQRLLLSEAPSRN